ncbi:MAG: PIN domain-containing protein [Bacteroidota bacterium]
MKEYLLDTDICIFLLQERFKIKEKVEDVGIQKCYISEITISELTYGAVKSEQFEKQIQDVIKIESLFSLLPIYESIRSYAEERNRLRKLGILIPDFDLIIGTTAVHHDMIMVTNNEKHLGRIDSIQIETWTKPPFNHYL